MTRSTSASLGILRLAMILVHVVYGPSIDDFCSILNGHVGNQGAIDWQALDFEHAAAML